MNYKFCVLLTLFFLFTSTLTYANKQSDEENLQQSISQLRSSIGRWHVTTSFLNEDASIAKKVSGVYEFNWVVPDRVISGKSEIAELSQISAILFYINEAKKEIEMVSVGADGKLWIMTGALGEEVRTSEEFKTSTGGTGQLRFTRFNVLPDSFESKMEYTEDGGKTWLPGNHQIFLREVLNQ